MPVSAHPRYSAIALLQRVPRPAQKLLGSGTRSSVAPKWGLGSLKAWFPPAIGLPKLSYLSKIQFITWLLEAFTQRSV